MSEYQITGANARLGGTHSEQTRHHIDGDPQNNDPDNLSIVKVEGIVTQPDRFAVQLRGPKGTVTIIASDEAEARMFAEAPNLLEIVGGLQWSGHSHDAYADQTCPVCYRAEGDGHNDDCEIGKAIFAAAKGQ